MNDSTEYPKDPPRPAGSSLHASAEVGRASQTSLGPRILVHGFYGAGNLGDEAILASIIHLFRQRLKHADLMVVSQDPTATQRLHPVRAVHRHDLHGQSAAISQAHLVIFGGGGLCNDYWASSPAAVLDDAQGGLAYYLRVPLLAALQDVPMVAYAQGVGPLVSQDARAMVRHVFANAADVSVRDRGSAALLREIGVTSPIDVSADPAFALSPEPDEVRSALKGCQLPGEGKCPTIGVSVRPFPSITSERLTLLAREVGKLAKGIRARVLVLPFCVQGPNADLESCEVFAGALPEGVSSRILRDEISPQGMLGLIGEMDLVLAVRYHASLFAILQRVPVVPVAYDPKVSAMFSDAGLEVPGVLDPSALDAAEVAAALNRAWESRETLARALAAASDRFQAAVARTADRVCALAVESQRRLDSHPGRNILPVWTTEGHTRSVRTQLDLAQTELAETRQEVEQLRKAEAWSINKAKELESQLLEARAQQALVAERAEEEVAAANARTEASTTEAELARRLAAQAKAEAEARAEAAERETTEGRARIEALAAERDEVRRQISEFQAQVGQQEQALAEAEAQVSQSGEALDKLRQEDEDLRKKLRFSKERARDIAEQLQQIWDSPSWQFLNRLHNSRVPGTALRLLKSMLPVRFKEYVKRKVRGSRPDATQPAAGATAAQDQATARSDTALAAGPADKATTPDAPAAAPKPRSTHQVLDDLRDFLDRVDRSEEADLVVFVAGVKYIQSEGQRVTQIVREFIRHRVPVLLLYFRWQSEYHQTVPRSDDPLFFQMPMDLFEAQRQMIMTYPFRSSLRRTCVFEFPHPWTFQWVNEFNLAGWSTVYDIIDDWEEFHEAGKAVWYEPAVEQYLCANTSAVTAIVPLLAEKARRWVPDLDVNLVPNGVSPDSFDLSLPRKALTRGEVTVGYFGYLAQAWFDWELVAHIAAKRPAWQFHIIGYGEPVPVTLTDNVQLLGKVSHHLLYAYTQNWDVAIVPFKPTTLSQGADPIKVYEYLTLGLPVVAADIPHLRSYPGVYVADSPEAFDRLLGTAAREGATSEEVKSFVAKCTWYQRGLNLIEAGRQGRCEPALSTTSSEDGTK